jgi:3'-phosphoadenosine 5'-phosphosulfate sulfotransferase (PAPS reductase)/FAD synthetase
MEMAEVVYQPGMTALGIVSFSGGKTSGYMSKLIKDADPSCRVVFMNTGMEHEKTLEFVDRCDKEFGLNVEWIEAKVHHGERKSTSFTSTTFREAERGISLAREVVQKYGLFGMGFLHCTRELKLNPFKAWKKENGLMEAKVAIGIRADEIDRVNPRYKDEQLYYPLIDLKVTKEDVNNFWSEQAFDLGIPDRLGNCVFCWKKSDKKLVANAKEYPDELKLITELENIGTKGSDKMFRGKKSSADFGCKESCELF